jgi:hypothetical protein
MVGSTGNSLRLEVLGSTFYVKRLRLKARTVHAARAYNFQPKT